MNKRINNKNLGNIVKKTLLIGTILVMGNLMQYGCNTYELHRIEKEKGRESVKDYIKENFRYTIPVVFEGTRQAAKSYLK